jgi:hypothetical protein
VRCAGTEAAYIASRVFAIDVPRVLHSIRRPTEGTVRSAARLSTCSPALAGVRFAPCRWVHLVNPRDGRMMGTRVAAEVTLQ